MGISNKTIKVGKLSGKDDMLNDQEKQEHV